MILFFELESHEHLLWGASEFVELEPPNALAVTTHFGNNVPAQSASEASIKQLL